jgi:hypothetical protein
MNRGTFDPRAIPVLTDAVESGAPASPPVDVAAIRAALLSATLDLTDSLLREAMHDVESLLFERLQSRLNAQLPGLVERVLQDYLPTEPEPPSAATIVDPDA